MNSGQENVVAAWKTFITEHTVPKGLVRPEVMRSWQRCYESGLDPWSSSFPMGSMQELEIRTKQNQDLLNVAYPIMQLLFTALNINISICDKDGFVFKLISPLDHYPRTLGSFVRESSNGNGAITIALQEKIATRLDGFEHYRAISHACSDASAPLIKNGALVGVINGVSLFGPLPDITLDMLKSGAELIEGMLEYETQHKTTLELIHDKELKKLFAGFIDLSSDVVIIAKLDGYVKYANKAARDYIENIFSGLNITDLFDNIGDALHLLDNEENPVQTYRLLNGKRVKLLRRGLIRIEECMSYMLVFDQNVDTSTVKAKDSPSCSYPYDLYIGESEAWDNVDEMVHRVAGFSSNVMIFGETGTGKEVVAKAIHKLSGRKGNFVAINCGNVPKELLCSEFFGYERGAFTGARAEGSIGKFEYANKGTLLLDEISEMPLDMQVSLLRFIQERAVTKINSNTTKKVDVRIIAATNKNIRELVNKGLFREDLYYRLAVIEIDLPLLSERENDVVLLAEYFIQELSLQLSIPVKTLSENAREMLRRHKWHGNVRELRNYIEKLMILTIGSEITSDVLKKYGINCAYEPPVNNFIERNSKLDVIKVCLEKHQGNIAKTAKELGIARNTLYRKIEKYNIQLKTSIVR